MLQQLELSRRDEQDLAALGVVTMLERCTLLAAAAEPGHQVEVLGWQALDALCAFAQQAS